MNLGSARVVLRTRESTDILDLAAPFCLRGWRVLLPLGAFTLLPGFAVCLAAHAWLSWPWPLVWLLAVALGGLLQAPFTLACGELLFHQPRDVRLVTLGTRLLRRLPAFVVAHAFSRLVHLLAASSVVLLPFSAVALFAVHEAVLLENAGPFSAIARSRRAARGQGLSVNAIALALALLPVGGILAGEVTGDALVATVLQLGEPFGTLWSRGGTPYALAGFFLTVPLTAAARFLKYIDLRTRKEGWDIQVRFLAIGARGNDRQHKDGPDGPDGREGRDGPGGRDRHSVEAA